MQLLKEGGVTKDNRNTKENENPSAIPCYRAHQEMDSVSMKHLFHDLSRFI